MPAFTLESVEGGLVPSSRYSGKVVIACLGSIYCEPCRELIPVLRKLQQQYEKRGLEVIGIDVDEATKTEEIKAFIAKRNVTYEVLRGTRDFGNRLGVFVVPTTFMVDSKGVIRKKYMGFKEREVLEKDLVKLLEELPPKEEESDGK
jgi:peroxiredoxin